MKRSAQVGIGVVGAVTLLAAVISVRTITYHAPQAAESAQVELASPVPLDLDQVALHLGEAVRIRTVSHQDPAHNDWAEWERLRTWLAATYPAVHAAARLELVAGHTLVYTWPGTDPARRPIVLMAHHDVVPVTPGTEGDWRHAPFAGVVADGAVWGRGALDNKSSLVALFESLEALARSGFVPAASIIVVSGHDEEAGGSGAAAAAGAHRVARRRRRVRARRGPRGRG